MVQLLAVELEFNAYEMPLDRFGDDEPASSASTARDNSKRTITSLQTKCNRLEHRLQVMEVELHNTKTKAAKAAADAAADAAAARPPRTPSSTDKRSSGAAAAGIAAALREQALVKALAAEVKLLEAAAARPPPEREALEVARAKLSAESRARSAAEDEAARCKQLVEKLQAESSMSAQSISALRPLAKRADDAEQALVMGRRQHLTEARGLRQRYESEHAAREHAEARVEQLEAELAQRPDEAAAAAGRDGRREAELALLRAELQRTEAGLAQAQAAAMHLGAKAEQNAALAEHLLMMQRDAAEQQQTQQTQQRASLQHDAGHGASEQPPQHRAARGRSLADPALSSDPARSRPASRASSAADLHHGRPGSKLRSARGLP